jgi:hypothetical protein
MNNKTFKNTKCRYCKKTDTKKLGNVKFYILGDNLEEPKAYHEKCLKKLWDEIIVNSIEDN